MGGFQKMGEENKYYLIKKRAVPEVLLKVVEAKRLLESERALTIQEATERVDLSRSSFYKYKDDIFPFHENVKGKTITFVLQMDDQPGILSNVIKCIATYHANILTIHQTIPINGVASLTLSVEIPNEGDITGMIDELEKQNGIHYVKVLARE
jgi:chorismate mutase